MYVIDVNLSRDSQQTVLLTLLADRSALAFFGVHSLGQIQCFDSCLVYNMLWCIHDISFTIIVVVFRSRLCTVVKFRLTNNLLTPSTPTKTITSVEIVSRGGTHFADSFFIHKWPFNIATNITMKECNWFSKGWTLYQSES